MRLILIPLLILFTASCSLIVFPPNESKIRGKEGFYWIEESGEDHRFTFLVEKGALPKNPVSLLDQKAHSHLNRCIEFLEIPDPKENYTYVIVKSGSRMKSLIGVSPQAMANPKQRLMVGEPAVMEVAHELAHVISIRHLGSSETWIQEGVAVATDDQWFSYDLHDLANYLLAKNHLLPMHELSAKFSKYDTLVTYPQAGSFIKFLKKTYGVAKLKQFWKSGPNRATLIYGKDLSILEREWLETISKRKHDKITYKIRSEQ